MNEETFKMRTKQLALAVIRLTERLPRTVAADVLGRQVLRSSTSIGANYRAACRAKSTADMINKLKIVEEESDETVYWLELIEEANLLPKGSTTSLAQEAGEITAMIVASLKTLRSKQAK